MSNIAWNVRRERNRVLLIVEGKHEKEKLLTRMLASFPEINIEIDNIWIYETNIYMLISKIIQEYGEDWFEQDIDLPYLIGKAKQLPVRETKKNYTNIFLIFDYERHDPNFSEQNILRMQEYFSSAEDVGKLYINYPMVESYMDFSFPPDEALKSKTVSSLMQNGSGYKNTIKTNNDLFGRIKSRKESNVNTEFFNPLKHLYVFISQLNGQCGQFECCDSWNIEYSTSISSGEIIISSFVL